MAYPTKSEYPNYPFIMSRDEVVAALVLEVEPPHNEEDVSLHPARLMRQGLTFEEQFRRALEKYITPDTWHTVETLGPTLMDDYLNAIGWKRL